MSSLVLCGRGLGGNCLVQIHLKQHNVPVRTGIVDN